MSAKTTGLPTCSTVNDCPTVSVKLLLLKSVTSKNGWAGNIVPRGLLGTGNACNHSSGKCAIRGVGANKIETKTRGFNLQNSACEKADSGELYFHDVCSHEAPSGHFSINSSITWAIERFEANARAWALRFDSKRRWRVKDSFEWVEAATDPLFSDSRTSELELCVIVPY